MAGQTLITSKHMLPPGLRIAMLCALALAVVGCSRDLSDLNRYVEEVKARPAVPPKGPPPLKPYQVYEYASSGKRNPFDSSVIETPEEVARQDSKKSDVQPPVNHTPEFLESFPLDSLRMVGSLQRGGVLWALIKTPDQTIQRVAPGNYMGENYGRITSVSEADILLEETVKDGFGGWVKRDGKVALSE